MALFFSALPMDVQLWILHIWIGQEPAAPACAANYSLLTHTIASMDIACCSRCIRPMFLGLMAHLQWPDPQPCAGKAGVDTGAYLSWASSRTLALKSVFIKEDNLHHLEHQLVQGMDMAFSFPSVHTLCVKESNHHSQTSAMVAVMASCPNLTSIEVCTDRRAFECKSSVVFSLQCSPKDKLRSLRLPTNAYCKGIISWLQPLEHFHAPNLLLYQPNLHKFVAWVK